MNDESVLNNRPVRADKKIWQEAAGERLWSVGELAGEHSISTRAIRFYEEQGFLQPLRRGRTRFFRQKDRIRLKLVLRGKRLGFSLGEISEIVFMYDAAPGEAGQLQLLLDKIEEKRAQLEQKQRDIEVTLEEMRQVERRCNEHLDVLQKGGR
jgi:DNA-binding transcriptional MerR regulator